MTRQETLTKLSKRTGLNEEFLGRLSEGRLTHYFNSSVDATPGSKLLREVASALTAVAATAGFFTGNLALGAAMTAATYYTSDSALNHSDGVQANKAVAQDIKSEVYGVIGQDTPAAPRYPSGPVNAPL